MKTAASCPATRVIGQGQVCELVGKARSNRLATQEDIKGAKLAFNKLMYSVPNSRRLHRPLGVRSIFSTQFPLTLCPALGEVCIEAANLRLVVTDVTGRIAFVKEVSNRLQVESDGAERL